MGNAVIGIDLGTSSCKATAFDLTGRVISRASVRYSTRTASDGSATQRPGEWIDGGIAALATLVHTSPRPLSVIGIGLSGQIGTHVLLDAAGAPLHDAITWQDGRSASAADGLWSVLDREQTARELDTWLPSGAAWPLVRMRWLAQALPRQFAAAARLAQPKDLLLAALTGRLASDPSSWRGLVDPRGVVLTHALEQLGLPDLTPDILPGTAEAGGLLPGVAARVGLDPGIPVFVGWNDLNAGLIGVGAIDESDGFDVGGTSEHIGVVSRDRGDGFRAVTVPQHGVTIDRYTVYGVTSNAGSAVEWMRRVLPEARDAETILEATHDSAGSLLFLPYLYGERAPIWDADAAGAFVGLRAGHGPLELGRAVLEGISFNLRQILDGLPVHPELAAIRSTGGTASSAAWNQLKADILRRPLLTTVESDSSSLGAAITAAVGVGVFSDVGAAVSAMVHEARTFEPVPASAGRYDELYLDFCRLHPALAETTHRLRRI